MAWAWAEDGTELVELQPGKAITRAMLGAQSCSHIQQSTASAGPGLTQKKGVILQGPNKSIQLLYLPDLPDRDL